MLKVEVWGVEMLILVIQATPIEQVSQQPAAMPLWLFLVLVGIVVGFVFGYIFLFRRQGCRVSSRLALWLNPAADQTCDGMPLRTRKPGARR